MKKTILNGLEKAKELLVNGVKWIASCAGEALSACEARKSSADIQARGELHNLERRALREMPTIELTNAQVPIEYQWCRNTVALNEPQAEFVFQHMLRQHTLDTDSKRELAEAVTPLVGVPALMQSVYKAHEYIGKNLVLPFINHGKPDEYKRAYADIVNAPLYEGTNHGLRLRYNLHSADLCEKFCGEYRKSRQYNAGLENDLQRIGVQIARVRAEGIYLEVYLKWE